MKTKNGPGEGPQLAALCAYIASHELDKSLRDENWPVCARGYNGPEFANNNYDARLEAAFGGAKTGNAMDIELGRDQLFLSYLGFEPGPIDGRYGERTRAALRQFQEHHRDEVSRQDGERDDETVMVLAGLVSKLVDAQKGDLV